MKIKNLALAKVPALDFGLFTQCYQVKFLRFISFEFYSLEKKKIYG